ncbi:hypothetical protein VTI74DRAFT_886 [Chaetomium olivicolor]
MPRFRLFHDLWSPAVPPGARGAEGGTLANDSSTLHRRADRPVWCDFGKEGRRQVRLAAGKATAACPAPEIHPVQTKLKRLMLQKGKNYCSY